MTVSIIIPVLNGQDDLERCVISALQQEEILSKEIIIVDNGSTDETSTIAQELCAQHLEVQYHSEGQKGSVYARNKGLRLAQGAWIQFLDVDDRLLPHKIANQLRVASVDHSVVIGRYIETTSKGKSIKSKSPSGDVWLDLITGRLGITSSNIYSRRALQNIDGWNIRQRTHQEYELMFRLLQNSAKIIYCDSYDTNKYERNYSISTSTYFPLDGVKLRLRIADYLTHNNLITEHYLRHLQQYYYDKTLWAYKSDPHSALQLLNEINLDLNLITMPIHHKLLVRCMGIHNMFQFLASLHRKLPSSPSVTDDISD